ncbi:MAG: gluconeogenesis factor YvcK family protein [Acidimicrobiia bacterium]
MSDQLPADGPKVVALGGGHGLGAVLRAARSYASSITAVVSVADDGGSSGRLRREMEVLAPGDVRKSLVALASEHNVWSDAFEHRFHGGDLDGHAFGNLVLVGLAQSLGSFSRAVAECGALLDVVGWVYPATCDPVALKASVADGAWVEGQVEIEASREIGRVELVPPDVRTGPDALAAIAQADQIVIAPGSLFTSVVPVVCANDIQQAIASTSATVVQVANLVAVTPEVEGLDGTDHLRAVLDHGARVDVFCYSPHSALAVDPAAVEALGVTPVAADVADPGAGVHDPNRLARALAPLT